MATATDPAPWQAQARLCRDAADVLVGCARIGVEVHDAQGRSLGKLAPPLAVAIAKRLRLSADAIAVAHRPVGLLVAADLDLAALVMGTDTTAAPAPDPENPTP